MPQRNVLLLLTSLALAISGYARQKTIRAGEPRAVADREDLARRLVAAAGVKGGLVVHVGCGDGRLTARLRAGDALVVQGLDVDAKRVDEARQHIRSLGIYGPVSASLFDGRRLPYAANLVNLIVVSGGNTLPAAEIARVLAPGGVLAARAGTIDPGKLQPLERRKDGLRGWLLAAKPVPKAADEWTHYRHGPDRNAVSRDQLVAPPRRLQWSAGPAYARSHEHTPSVQALVSGGGRVFYVTDEASRGDMRQPGKWSLLARDAYNGILLWERHIPVWFPHLMQWYKTPDRLHERVVAAGNRVYVTLGLHAPVTALDAASGKPLKVYPHTEGAMVIIHHRGTLLACVREVTAERREALALWEELSRKPKSRLQTRETKAPLFRKFQAAEARAATRIVAIETATGKVLWQKPAKPTPSPAALCARGDSVFYHSQGTVFCLDVRTGARRWAQASPRPRALCGDRLVCSDNRTVAVLSTKDGGEVWKRKLWLSIVRDAFVIGDSLWLCGFKPFTRKVRGKLESQPAYGPLFFTRRSMKTGEVLKNLEPENPGHHHRCYDNVATHKYILAGRRGTEFVDLQTGEVLWNSWARGACRYGVMPANGLLYAPPHACGCYAAARLIGFNALAGGEDPAKNEGKPRPVRGPAFEEKRPATESKGKESCWPTFRGDGARSCRARSALPARLTVMWQRKVGGTLTAPTVAGGRVLVSSVHAHRISALDAASGKPLWNFTADARVDSPPTLHGGRAFFGCRDGKVYCLRAADGALAWRLRAARRQRYVIASGQLESALPVPGSVLVEDGVVYATAGRSSYLDGGIDLLRIRATTGEVLSRTALHSPDPKTGRQPPHKSASVIPGSRWDILSGDPDFVYLREDAFDRKGALAKGKGNPHLLSLTSLLDGDWAHRAYSIFGTRCSVGIGCARRDKGLIFGRLLVFDTQTVYGYGRAHVHWSNAFRDKPHRLFAVGRLTRKLRWEKSIPIQVRAMILAGKVVFAAGPATKDRDRTNTAAGRTTPLLMAFSTADGSELSRVALPTAPVFDGMAAAGGRLYLSLVDGNLICLAKPEE
jgi:outer membrane protein assembly factor BamB